MVLDSSLKLWYFAPRCFGVDRCLARRNGEAEGSPAKAEYKASLIGGRSIMENARISGTVQWFSRVKGYGFIRPDGQEEDVFVHYSVIQGEGYRNLNKGQRVELTVEDSPKGPQAVDVVGLDEIIEEVASADF
jgi:cold shock protein